MHEILPKTVVPLTSPAAAGELSRRSRSELAVQNTLPFKTGLVGNSRIWLFPTVGSAELRRPEALTGLRKTSNTPPFWGGSARLPFGVLVQEVIHCRGLIL